MTPGPPGGLLRRAPGSDGGVNAPRSSARPVGLFCGLTVVDVIQLVEAPPEPDEKIVALDQLVAAGGPATNAAVAFSALGGRALLAAPVGVGPLADLVRADLAAAGVELIDCAALGPAGTDTPDPTASPAPGLSVSSCTITASTGARSVVSTNARTATDPAALDVYASRAGDGREPPPDVVLIDGHNPALAALALDLAAGADAFTVMDAGSWKDDAADLPGRCDVVAASARFYPPGPAGPLTGPAEAARWLREAGAGGVVITRGARPALWWCTADHAESRTGGHDGIHGSVIPPQVEVADTLGAGDVFHGALAHALAHVTPGRLTGAGLAAAVERACVIAATSTEVFGTRAWRQRLET